MKAIILMSSIFYLLGLKISNQIDLVKKTCPADTVITHSVTPGFNESSIDFSTAEKETETQKTGLEDKNCETEKETELK